MKKVSVIIVTSHASKDDVIECLKSIKSISYPKEYLKIFLVDNMSKDDTVAVVEQKFTHVSVIQNKKNLGFAKGNNIGMARALKEGASYIVLLNNDTVVDKDWLKELVTVAESESRIGAVQSRVMLYGDKDRINTDGNRLHFLGFGYCGNYKKKNIKDIGPHEVAYGSGASLLIKREVIDKIGDLEEKLFMYHEDLEYGWRMQMAGYKTYAAPRSVVWHKYLFDKPSSQKFYYMERNRFIVMFENYKLLTLLLLTPACILMEIGIHIYALINRWLSAKIRADIYFLNPKNILDILKTRKRKQDLRKIGDREVVKHFTGIVQFEDLKNPLLLYIANPIINVYWLLIKKIILW